MISNFFIEGASRQYSRLKKLCFWFEKIFARLAV